MSCFFLISLGNTIDKFAVKKVLLNDIKKTEKMNEQNVTVMFGRYLICLRYSYAFHDYVLYNNVVKSFLMILLKTFDF